ncbi:MAG: 4'-phosphopantetheinyl transferase superfamily protein [Bacteroidales bacterium]|nr:4'-phosphopantetheinyl transferase superfamily protein [Bacteroidales bacterium]
MLPIKVFVTDFDERYLSDERFLSLGPIYFGEQWKSNRPMRMTLLGQLLVHYVFRLTFPDKELPKYDFNENGKPFFAQYPDFQFNISDSKQRVVAAFDTEDVGVDVEYLRTHRPELMQRFFSDEERQSVERQPDDDAKGRAFTMLWSLKEALVKCLGTGIAKDFTNYSVDFEKETVAPAASGLVVSGTVLDGDCFVTLCRRGEKPQFDFRFVGIEEMLDLLKY